VISTETERLRIRPLTGADAAFIRRLYNTEKFLRYIGDRKIRSLQDAEEFLRDGPMRMYRESGVGLCRVELKATGEPVGTCGLIRRESLDDIDIGYAFLPEHEGRGYASESCRAVFEFARDVLQLGRLVAITQADNAGSIRVLEKLGLRFEKNLEEPEDEPALALYSVGFESGVSGR
jgi:RimJ/RimL family protein N-acetyltransferase